MQEKAIQHLQKDPILAKVIEKVDLVAEERSNDVFIALVRSITGQQLSVQAARTIFQRLLTLFDTATPNPKQVLDLEFERLRSVGLSKQKTQYILNVATFAEEHALNTIDWEKRSDAEIIAFLSQIKGVGVWTVQMLMMFTMRRPDVFPSLDLGIQQGMAMLYDLDDTGKKLQQKMTLLAANWQPHRSLACRYIWAWKNEMRKKRV